MIEQCKIYHNGDPSEPGYNHNLYLGGTSVVLRFCEVHSSLTGHNVKSRAHYTRVEYCYVHHSANREFDLVDASETALPESHAVLVGNVIVKNPQCEGNRTVIHFGQDGGKQHDGTLYLVFNTVVTPFIAPVVDLSASRAKASLVGNLVSDGGVRQANQVVAVARNGATLEAVTGTYNWLSGGFGGAAGTGLDPKTNLSRARAIRYSPIRPSTIITSRRQHLRWPARLCRPRRSNCRCYRERVPEKLRPCSPGSTVIRRPKSGDLPRNT